MPKKNAAEGTSDKSEHISAIEIVRAMRGRFLIDPPFDALQNEIGLHELVDPLRRIQQYAADDGRFHRRISPPKADPTTEMTAIAVYRLTYGDLHEDQFRELLGQQAAGEFALTQEQNSALRESHQRGAEQMFEDGYTARERRVISLVDPGFSFAANPKFGHETHSYNGSLNPRQHSLDHELKMKVVEANKAVKRPRTAIKRDILQVTRGRKHWRPRHLFAACEAMNKLVSLLIALRAQRDIDPDYDNLKRRYCFDELTTSASKYAALSEEARLAAAIISAEPKSRFSGRYVPNDKLAISVLVHYGVYEYTKKKLQNSSYSKSLILKRFTEFYSRAI